MKTIILILSLLILVSCNKKNKQTTNDVDFKPEHLKLLKAAKAMPYVAVGEPKMDCSNKCYLMGYYIYSENNDSCHIGYCSDGDNQHVVLFVLSDDETFYYIYCPTTGQKTATIDLTIPEGYLGYSHNWDKVYSFRFKVLGYRPMPDGSERFEGHSSEMDATSEQRQKFQRMVGYAPQGDADWATREN